MCAVLDDLVAALHGTVDELLGKLRGRAGRLQQLRHMLHEGWGGQQRGSSSNLTRPYKTPRLPTLASV